MNFTSTVGGLSFNTSATSAFAVALPTYGRVSIGVNDMLVVNNTYGMVVASNDSLIVFTVSSTSTNVALQYPSLNITGYVNYYLDIYSSLFYVSFNSTTIYQYAINSTTKALYVKGTISNMPHDYFNVYSGTILVVGCSTCNYNSGEISIIDISNVSSPVSMYSINGDSSNSSAYYESVNSSSYLIGERAFYNQVDPNNFYIIYTARSSNSTSGNITLNE